MKIHCDRGKRVNVAGGLDVVAAPGRGAARLGCDGRPSLVGFRLESKRPNGGQGRPSPLGRKAYFASFTSGCVHAVSNSPATLPFTFGFEEMIFART
jgi:hypothetical protein